MKLYIKFHIIMIGCFASLVHAEQLTQEKYDSLLNQYMQIIQNTKVVLDSEDTKSTFAEQNEAFCERINAYQDIKKISEQNKQLENSSHMLLAANYYLERQSKSLELGGFSDSTFCKRK